MTENRASRTPKEAWHFRSTVYPGSQHLRDHQEKLGGVRCRIARENRFWLKKWVHALLYETGLSEVYLSESLPGYNSKCPFCLYDALTKLHEIKRKQKKPEGRKSKSGFLSTDATEWGKVAESAESWT